MRLSALVPVSLLLLAVGCSTPPGADPATRGQAPAASAPASTHPAPTASSPTSPAPAAPGSGGTDEPTPDVRPVRPGDLRVGIAVAAVDHLAGDIGPRHGTSAAYRRAARWVAGRLRTAGYDIRREPFDVPGGDSWGVPVAAGRSVNVVAEPPGFDPSRPHLVLGAHLDTVPQAPGAEDNASGVGVLLAVARATARHRTRLPVVLVAFGAEEPRGPGDDDHHYGSRHHVAAMGAARRRATRGMVSLDRVGVGEVLPICSASGPDRLRGRLLAAAERAGVAHRPCEGNRASDHWSFVRAGLPGVRLGSTPYAGYHSPSDVPAVVEAAQLRRAGRTVLAWLSPR